MLHNPEHIEGRVGLNPGVSGSHGKQPCLQVSLGLRATVVNFTSGFTVKNIITKMVCFLVVRL